VWVCGCMAPARVCVCICVCVCVCVIVCVCVCVCVCLILHGDGVAACGHVQRTILHHQHHLRDPMGKGKFGRIGSLQRRHLDKGGIK
jgi:hypothetical protein